MTRIVVSAHSRIYRDGLRDFLDRKADVCVVATTGSVDDLLGLASRYRAQLVLVDQGLPGALETISRIAWRAGAPRIVVLSVREQEADVLACARAGAHGYVGHDASLEDLYQAIVAALEDRLVCSPKAAAWLMREVARVGRGAPWCPPEALTSREFEVASLLSVGLSNREIGERLSIGVSTVKNHVHHILEKLRVRRRGQAVAALRARAVAPTFQLLGEDGTHD